MFIIDISNIMSLVLILSFTSLMIYLGREMKKSYIPAIALVMYLGLLIMYVIQFATMQEVAKEVIIILTKCMAIDFLLILITYLGYLWVDGLTSKDGNKKEVKSDDLNWLWKKV